MLHRSSAGEIHSGGSIVFNNTFGQESASLTSPHGNDLSFTTQSTNLFNPNNLQTLTNGEAFNTINGHGNTYIRRDSNITVGGTLTVVTGSPKLYDDEFMTEYVKIRGEIATAQCSPYTSSGGQSNNSGATYERKGSLDPDSGSTVGMSYPVNPARRDYTDFLKSKVSTLVELENQMGEGGDLALTVGKDITINAGAKAIAIDSGYINPVGYKLTKNYKIDGAQEKGKRAVAEYTAAPSYLEKDTFSNIPFGTLNLAGANRVLIRAGAGGFNVEGAGSIKLAGTGLSWFSGSQVNIVATGTSFLHSKAFLATTDNFNVDSPESLFTGNMNINNNTVIGGNLEVGGDLTVYGDIICKGKITADGDIVAGGSGGISLLNHKHGGVATGGGTTGTPQ